MTDISKRKRGGQPGNRNARKHGYYSKVITEKDKNDYKQAIDVVGIDEEIALLRARIRSVIAHDPDNITLIMQATSTLARLLRTRRYIGTSHDIKLRNALGSVLRDLAIPLGVKVIEVKDRSS